MNSLVTEPLRKSPSGLGRHMCRAVFSSVLAPVPAELLQAAEDTAGVAVSCEAGAGVQELFGHKTGGRPGQGANHLHAKRARAVRSGLA